MSVKLLENDQYFHGALQSLEAGLIVEQGRN